MPDVGNKGVTISYKNNNGIISLYPKTPSRQIMDMELGTAYGPYTIVLEASKWVNNQQTVALNGITENDILFVVKSLNGTVDEMRKQKEAYNLLASDGVESINNAIIFTCDKGTPTVDITVQVSWNR